MEMKSKCLNLMASLLVAISSLAQTNVVEISKGWQLQDTAKVRDKGEKIATITYQPRNWYPATVPGTVLTTLVNNKVYPDPMYGENNRPEIIPESLSRTSYWYRTVIDVPQS